MIDPFTPLGFGMFVVLGLTVAAILCCHMEWRRQAGRDNLARWLGSDRQHLVREDRDDLGADQCPHQFADGLGAKVSSSIHEEARS